MQVSNAPPFTPSEHFIEANGITIHYKEWGSGHPLLLLHGGTATLEEWQAQIALFAPYFRVIAPDTRGHGKTSHSAQTLSYPLMAQDTAAFIRALNLRQPLVFGYSDGGQVALELGIHHPDLAGALVLGGTIYQFTEKYFDFLRVMEMERAGAVDIEAMEQNHAGWVEYLRDAHPRADDPDYWQSLMRQISALWWTPPVYSANDLDRITVACLILVGDRDDGIPLEQTLAMFQGIPNAELAVMPNADHGSTISDLSMPIVLDFLRRHALAAR